MSRSSKSGSDTNVTEIEPGTPKPTAKQLRVSSWLEADRDLKVDYDSKNMGAKEHIIIPALNPEITKARNTNASVFSVLLDWVALSPPSVEKLQREWIQQYKRTKIIQRKSASDIVLMQPNLKKGEDGEARSWAQHQTEEVAVLLFILNVYFENPVQSFHEDQGTHRIGELNTIVGYHDSVKVYHTKMEEVTGSICIFVFSATNHEDARAFRGPVAILELSATKKARIVGLNRDLLVSFQNGRTVPVSYRKSRAASYVPPSRDSNNTAFTSAVNKLHGVPGGENNTKNAAAAETIQQSSHLPAYQAEVDERLYVELPRRTAIEASNLGSAGPSFPFVGRIENLVSATGFNRTILASEWGIVSQQSGVAHLTFSSGLTPGRLEFGPSQRWPSFEADVFRDVLRCVLNPIPAHVYSAEDVSNRFATYIKYICVLNLCHLGRKENVDLIDMLLRMGVMDEVPTTQLKVLLYRLLTYLEDRARNESSRDAGLSKPQTGLQRTMRRAKQLVFFTLVKRKICERWCQDRSFKPEAEMYKAWVRAKTEVLEEVAKAFLLRVEQTKAKGAQHGMGPAMFKKAVPMQQLTEEEWDSLGIPLTEQQPTYANAKFTEL